METFWVVTTIGLTRSEVRGIGENLNYPRIRQFSRRPCLLENYLALADFFGAYRLSSAYKALALAGGGTRPAKIES